MNVARSLILLLSAAVALGAPIDTAHVAAATDSRAIAGTAIDRTTVDRATAAQTAFARSAAAQATVDQTAAAKATAAHRVVQQETPCEIHTGKVADPTSVLVGQEVEITLTVDARCQGGEATDTDVVLAIDRSSSMLEEGRWAATIDAASRFVDLVEFGPLQVAVLTFSGNLVPTAPESDVHVPLTSDGDAVRAGLGAIPDPLPVTWATNFTEAIEASQVELGSPRGRPDARKVIVMLTDGDHNSLFARNPILAADEAKAAGVTIVAIGLGVGAEAEDRLTRVASEGQYFPAPDPQDLADIYAGIARQIQSAVVTNLIVTDILAEDVDLVVGSPSPEPTSIETKQLVWRIPSLPPSGWIARYRVRPTVPGTYSTNKLATVEFTTPEGRESRAFPIPTITVRAPEQLAIFMPRALQGYCRPSRPFDVVLAIDSSSSMWGEKHDRARQAARDFVNLLAMPPTQASILGFDEDAEMVQPLTSDREAVLAALDTLPRGQGTRIDRALDVAVDELTGDRRSPEHAPVVVLLTDGQQAPDQESKVLDAANRARAAGIVVFTVGIGDEVSEALLVQVAGDPDRYFQASLADLRQIYRSIAGALPCVTG